MDNKEIAQQEASKYYDVKSKGWDSRFLTEISEKSKVFGEGVLKGLEYNKEFVYEITTCTNKPEFILVNAKNKKEADEKFKNFLDENPKIKDDFGTYSTAESKRDKNGVIHLNYQKRFG